MENFSDHKKLINRFEFTSDSLLQGKKEIGKIELPTKESGIKHDKSNKHTYIKEVWQKYVDIQEQLIKQRCAPIDIDPESAIVDDGKLTVAVDNSLNEKRIDAIFKNKLGVDHYDLDSGHLFIDETKWNAISELERQEIAKELSGLYVEINTTLSINATINYGGSIRDSKTLSIEELRKLDRILNEGKLIEGEIDDKVAFISRAAIDFEGYMKYLFGERHVTTEVKEVKRDKKKGKKGKEQYIFHWAKYKNEYIPWEEMQKYANVGLYCKGYEIIFNIKNQDAKEEIGEIFYDNYIPDQGVFKFKRDFTKDTPCDENYVAEANENIRAFMRVALTVCAERDIDICTVFTYAVNKEELTKSKFADIAQLISGKGEGYSFNRRTGDIGIDFNWRTVDIGELASEIERQISFIKIPIRDNHRFKCNINIKMVGYGTLKKVLEYKYEDIRVQDDSAEHKIEINLPYRSAEQYDYKLACLEGDLQQLSIAGFGIQFAPKINGKVCLNVKYDKQSWLDDRQETIEALRSSDFGVTESVGFGKLIRVKYPELTFDIYDESAEEIFEETQVKTIYPLLSGELEKIYRLRNSFSKATIGEELVNPRLGRFIFDSAEATKTDDIDLLLKRDGFEYNDLCDNLLNSKVNESQKDAIIKAMNADDLAVIQGPPGTGKSTAIAELIWQLVRKGQQPNRTQERVLLTSETNLAVDNAISRIVNSKTNLVKPVRFGRPENLAPEGIQFSLELMKEWVQDGDDCLETCTGAARQELILKNWLNNISNRSFGTMESEENEIIRLWRNYLKHPGPALREITFKRYRDNVNVIGATCSSIGDKRADSRDNTAFYMNYCSIFNRYSKPPKIEFTTVIQDESSKATPAELILPFVYGRRAIVIGDHRQLPPMLDKEEFEQTLDYAQKNVKAEEEKEKIERLKSFVEKHFDEMEVSHFQRLYESIDDSLKGTFNLQYRMHPDINEVIKQFYLEDGGLNCGLVNPVDLGVNDPDLGNPASRYHGINIPGLISESTHVLFIDTNTPEMQDGTSRVNYGEVATIDNLLTRLENAESFKSYLSKFPNEDDKEIGLISFYGKQLKLLKAVAISNHPKLRIRVSTVDRFQGMERNIVIVSMVRSNIIQSAKNQKPDMTRYPKLGFPRQNSLGFAQSPNRLNVALSRAKRLLVIVGNRELFSEKDIYRNLFNTIEANKNNKVVKQQDVQEL